MPPPPGTWELAVYNTYGPGRKGSPDAGALSDLKGKSSSCKDGEKVFLLKYVLNITPQKRQVPDWFTFPLQI